MWRHITHLVYLMAPAYVANMAPPFARFWPGWNRPISERRLGSHKTVVGAVAGIGAAVLTAAVQARLHRPGTILDYREWLLIGTLLGVGAIGGDATKSLLKRARGSPPGSPWPLMDQLDFAVGALVLIQPLARLAMRDAAIIAALTFAADLVVNRIAFHLRIRETPW